MHPAGATLAGTEGSAPAISIDAGNVLWAAWTATAPRASAQDAGRDAAQGGSLADRLVCRALRLPKSVGVGDSSATLGRWEVGEQEGLALDPVLASPPDEPGAWLAWVTRRDGQWSVRAAFLQCGEEAVPLPLTPIDAGSSPEGTFSPAALALQGRRALLAFEVVVGGSRRIRVVRASAEGVAPMHEVEAPGAHGQFRPALGLDGSGKPWLVYEGIAPAGTCDLFCCPIDLDSGSFGPPSKLVDHSADDMHPAMAPAAEGGWWLAWTSNRRGDEADLPHWVYLARVVDGRVVEGPVPASPPPGPDEAGEVQGWEFPDLLLDLHGRLWVAGRSSQTFFVQWLRSGVWSRRGELSGRDWGCRSRRIRLAQDRSGNPWAIYRGVREVRVEGLPVLEPLPEPAAPTPATSPASQARHPRYAFPLVPCVRRKRPRPRAVRFGGKELFAYFGDLHCHTAYSDGSGSVDEFYRRSRDLYGDDFGAVTDHDHLQGKVLTPSEWAFTCEAARTFNEPGRYVAFSGFEWTTPLHPRGSGHKHVILPVDDAPLFRHLAEGGFGGDAGNDGRALLAYVKRFAAVAIPHHVGWGGTDPANHDPSAQPCFEMCSTLGSYERESEPAVPYVTNRIVPGYFLREFLRQGLQFGFVGGSDGHGLLWHHGVGWKRDDFRGGLTGVLAPQLDRASILEAIRTRRCYATSGVPILLDVRLNGVLMGGTVTAAPGDAVAMEVHVLGTAPLKAAYVVRNGDDVYRVEGGGKASLGFEYEEKGFDGGCSGSPFYYVRVVQEDGEVAWSSPIWVQTPARNEGRDRSEGNWDEVRDPGRAE